MDRPVKFMVAFSSPKRSLPVVSVAARHALANDAELVLLRVLPDAEKVGVIAQLIASDRPQEKAQQQLDMVTARLKEKGVKASGVLRVGEVGPGIIKVAEELAITLIFIGTLNLHQHPRFYGARDPIVHYLVDNCGISLCLVRADDPCALPPIIEVSANED